MNKHSISRRSFVGRVAAASAGVMVVPRHVLGGPGFQAPSDTLNVAAIGAGGMGSSNMSALTSQNIVAICDVDFERVEGSLMGGDGKLREDRAALQKAYSKAKRYSDFRKMLDEQQDIEAVVIATPDHVHAVAANRAMKMGKHVYVQKPLTYTVEESRVLRKTAKETGVVTQMGNQGHSLDDTRRIVELVRGGAIGNVTEAHIWTNRPKGYWPQGIPRPEEIDPIPESLDWDLWLAGTRYRPYNDIYAPFNWRGWVDFGAGALGDMGAHLIDQTYWALELNQPTKIETRHTPWGGPEDDPATFPLATITYYEFDRGDGADPFKLTWYDGGLMPATPEEMPADMQMDPGGGGLIIGDKGKLLHETYGRNPRLLPESLEEEATDIPKTMPRVEAESHEMNWAKACMGQAEISCPFDYAARLTETMLLGLVALRAGQPIEYDSANMKIPSMPDAEQYLTREYREGWSLEG
ncbi:MAG: Gfo/Idh/MocA family protein [Rhodothermales bacterium]